MRRLNNESETSTTIQELCQEFGAQNDPKRTQSDPK